MSQGRLPRLSEHTDRHEAGSSRQIRHGRARLPTEHYTGTRFLNLEALLDICSVKLSELQVNWKLVNLLTRHLAYKS